ncbi:MAG: S-layer homology domain-containing protein [Clostridiales bacterium]|nr:S-layer homology domain-containing protein [Clostridiales bacterium]
MKRTFAKLLSLFVVLTLVIAMLPAVFAVDGIVSVTAENTTLKVNKSTTVSVKDANGTDVPNVTLSSDHDDIVSVIDSSTIKALKVGSATITATVTAEDKTVQTLGSVQITVQSGVSAIAPANETIEIDVDNAKTASLSVTLTGAASGDVLAVRSSDESVVTAQAGAITLSDGTCTVTLTAVKTGTAAVTLSCGTATAQVAVTVKASGTHTVTFEKQKLTVKKGETAVNPATKAPAAGDKLTYASSSTAVATVDASTGAVTGVAAGTATITATVKNTSDVIVGTASYTVEVADAYKIELSAAPSSLTAGSASTVSATVYQYMTEQGYVPYQQSVELTWNAYKESVADLGGSDPSKAVKTTTSSGSSSVTLYTYATGTSKTAVQVPVTVSVTISGTIYQASPLSVSVSPASAPSFAVHEEDYFDPDDFSEAVDGATGRYAGKLSAITIEGSNGGSVYENGSRVSSSTKYYVSGARNKLISSLYFRTSSTSTTNAYFTYIGYDADGDVIAAGKVTLGDESVDMEYSASFGGSVTFLESDFSKAFSGKAGEKLDYVTFAMNRATVVMNNKTYSLNDGSNAAIFGWAYTTSKATTKLSSTDKCYYQASYTQLDLDEITYVTGSYRTKYTVYLPYTAVGTSGSRYEGYTAITVSGDDSITASGASMKTLGAADAVLRAYPNAAYVMFKQPAVSEGRLLYNFRSVAAQNYTAVDYSKDQFYLSGTSAKNLYLDSVFFLPAADCSTQIRLAFTVYGTSGTQLGSGELTVRVASKTASSVFSDVNARTCSWAANAVDFMNEYGLVKGTGTSTFGWKGNMTRGDFVLILYRNAGSPSVYGVSNPFTDVKSTDYYYEAVLWAYRNNVVNGTSTTTFGPKGKITREQIASILWRLAGKPVYSASLRSYTDYASVSDYAYDAMSWAVGSGYVKGSGAKLSPKNNATRAEVAVMLHRYLTK